MQRNLSSEQRFRSGTVNVFPQSSVSSIFWAWRINGEAEASRNSVRAPDSHRRNLLLFRNRPLYKTILKQNIFIFTSWLNGEKETLDGLWKKEPMLLMSTTGTGEKCIKGHWMLAVWLMLTLGWAHNLAKIFDYFGVYVMFSGSFTLLSLHTLQWLLAIHNGTIWTINEQTSFKVSSGG